jgi:hypothetical protein
MELLTANSRQKPASTSTRETVMVVVSCTLRRCSSKGDGEGQQVQPGRASRSVLLGVTAWMLGWLEMVRACKVCASYHSKQDALACMSRQPAQLSSPHLKALLNCSVAAMASGGPTSSAFHSTATYLLAGICFKGPSTS